MALPTFLIIGAMKSGTTSLHRYLDQHPQIQMSARKEPSFFSGPEAGIPYTLSRVSDVKQYEELFDPTVEVRGEASPNYTIYPRRQGVPERIKRLVPKAKLIYIVRDPIDRTVSHYQHRVALVGERRSLEDALSDLSDPYSPCICTSRYALQLDCYLRHFSQEQILVIDQANLLADRRSTLRRVFAFLAVDDEFDSPHFDGELNKSTERRVYPHGLARFVGGTVTPRLQWLPPRVRTSLRQSVERTFLPPLEPPILSKELRARLEEVYAGEVERLRAITGEAFPTWSI